MLVRTIQDEDEVSFEPYVNIVPSSRPPIPLIPLTDSVKEKVDKKTLKSRTCELFLSPFDKDIHIKKPDLSVDEDYSYQFALHKAQFYRLRKDELAEALLEMPVYEVIVQDNTDIICGYNVTNIKKGGVYPSLEDIITTLSMNSGDEEKALRRRP